MARTRLLTDEEILARVRPVFLERGFAARTRQVADAAGLTWGRHRAAGQRRSLDPGDRVKLHPVRPRSIDSVHKADSRRMFLRLREIRPRGARSLAIQNQGSVIARAGAVLGLGSHVHFGRQQVSPSCVALARVAAVGPLRAACR